MNVPQTTYECDDELFISDQACDWYRIKELTCTSIKLLEDKEANRRL